MVIKQQQSSSPRSVKENFEHIGGRERVSARRETAGSNIRKGATKQRTVSLRILLLSLVPSMIVSFYLGLYFRSIKDVPARVATPASALGDQCEQEGFEEYQLCEASPDIQDEDGEERDLMIPDLILFDVKQVNSVFFGSQALDELVKAVTAILKATEMKLLWLDCQPSQERLVNCVGILSNGCVSLYAVAKSNVVLFSVFLDDELQDLAPLLTAVQEAFLVRPVDVTWSGTRRAFAPQDDAAVYVRSPGGFKQHVASVQTDFQLIDVYEACLQKDNYRKCRLKSYIQSLNSDQDSYELRHPEYFRPDRYVFLDGVMQSVRFGESAYHEALVHPAMFAHPHPRRAAVIGGGEGATLREILKHNTIEEAIMVEIDEIMVNVSRQHLPEWPDCSDLVGSAEWCGDDPRASMYYEDAIGWFTSRYGAEKSEEEKIDVIIMDALDPESDIPFARALYDDDSFIEAVYRSLSTEGIIAMQLGETSRPDYPPDSISKFKNRVTIRNLLARVGFESLQVYDEAHGGYGGPWSFLVAFKSQNTLKRWYSSESQLEEQIVRRLVYTKTGKTPLRYFDSPTMVSYQMPNSAFERVFCRERPLPEECDLSGGFDPFFLQVTENDVEVGPKGDGIFGKVDIGEGRVHLMLESAAHSLRFGPEARSLLQRWKTDIGRRLFKLSPQNPFDEMISSGPLLFAKEGCTNLTNIRYETIERKCYSPVIERHRQSRHAGTRVTKHLRPGDELIIDAC